MITSFLATIIAILATWLIMTIGLVGDGLLILYFFRLKKFCSTIIILSFWLGFAAFLAIGQLWNIFLPADWRLWIICWIAATSGIVLYRREIAAWINKLKRQWKPISILFIVFLVLAIQVAFNAMKGTPVHDTGSYHLPATLWLHEFPIVPGLSNLHSRLGFNSSIFVFSASLSNFIWSGRPHHIMMGPLIMMTYLISFSSLNNIRQNFRKVGFQDIFGVSLVLPVFFLYHWMNYAASLSPNASMYLLLLVIFWMILKGYTQEHRLNKSNYIYVAASILSVIAISVKLTVAPLAAFLWLVLFYRVIRGKHKPYRTLAVFTILLFALVIIIPWLIRSVILSGYPLYPFTTGGFNVDWKVPEIQAQLDAAWTRSYSRGAYAEPPHGLEWIGGWMRHLFNITRLFSGASIPILLAAMSLFLMLVFFIFRGRKQFQFLNKMLLMLLLSVFGAVIIWFFTAPDIRFGIAYLWLIACFLLSFLFFVVWNIPQRGLKTSVVFLLAALVGMAVLLKTSRLYQKIKHIEKQSLTLTTIRSFNEILNEGLSPLPRVKMWEFTTNSGLVVEVPISGNQVWNAPLLSTPHPSPGLSLRNPGNIGDGFKSVGEWRPYGYPILMYPWHNYVIRRLDAYYEKKEKE